MKTKRMIAEIESYDSESETGASRIIHIELPPEVQQAIDFLKVPSLTKTYSSLNNPKLTPVSVERCGIKSSLASALSNGVIGPISLEFFRKDATAPYTIYAPNTLGALDRLEKIKDFIRWAMDNEQEARKKYKITIEINDAYED